MRSDEGTGHTHHRADQYIALGPFLTWLSHYSTDSLLTETMPDWCFILCLSQCLKPCWYSWNEEIGKEKILKDSYVSGPNCPDLGRAKLSWLPLCFSILRKVHCPFEEKGYNSLWVFNKYVLNQKKEKFNYLLKEKKLSSLIAQMVKKSPAMQETWVWSLGWEDPLEKEMATHYTILAWIIPWTEEPGRLKSRGLQRIRHDWVTFTLRKKIG